MRAAVPALPLLLPVAGCGQDPRLHPVHAGPRPDMADKLLRLLEGDDTLWLEFLDRDRVDEVSTAAVKEWEKLHFRYYLLIGPIRGQLVINSVQSGK